MLYITLLKDAPTTQNYTLSLHDALPISRRAAPRGGEAAPASDPGRSPGARGDRKSTRLNSSHVEISYAVLCLKKKNTKMKSVIVPETDRACNSVDARKSSAYLCISIYVA